MRENPKEHFNVVEPVPHSLGARLAVARQAQGLTQREAAMRISVDTGVIQALEENDFSRLGAPVFVRGYLSRYARLLDLPGDDLVEEYRQLGMNEPPPLRLNQPIKPQASMSSAGFRWITYLCLLALVAYGVWVGVEQVSYRLESAGQDEDAGLLLPQPADNGFAGLPLPRQETASPAPDPAPATAPRPPAPDAAGDDTVRAQAVRARDELAEPEPEPADSPAVESVEPVAAAPETPAEAPAATPPDTVEAAAEPQATDETGDAATGDVVADGDVVAEASQAPEAAAPPPGQTRLTLRFDEDCWVDVKDAQGNRLAYGIMKANSMRSLTGPAPFSLVLGNAAAVNLRIDGQPVDRADYVPRQGSVSRVVLDAPGG